MAELDREGRLLRADEAMWTLNQRAGGVEGGVIAIPALYRLAELTGRLQMRLARAVRVLDESENLELWVEAEAVDEIIHLAILSWRNLNQSPAFPISRDGRKLWFPGNHMALVFDKSLRLIRTSGFSMEGPIATDFGKKAANILGKLLKFEDVPPSFLDSIDAMAAFAPVAVMLHEGRKLLISGHPVPDAAGAMAGYECRLEQIPPGLAHAATATPGALIGKHLAPVLRQPLDRIIANAETIGSELQGPIRENYAAYARDIANAARHLSALVDDLGDLEAIERSDFSTAPDTIELGDVARRVAGLLALKTADHSIRLTTPDSSVEVAATAEFRRVLQIMLNLVTNAVRYSPNGTEIRIEIGRSGQYSIISVIDRGNGIDPQDRDRIFDKFERLGRTGDGGSGLGLYISRKLARAMGGDLTVDEAAGGGAVFSLRLPFN